MLRGIVLEVDVEVVVPPAVSWRRKGPSWQAPLLLKRGRRVQFTVAVDSAKQLCNSSLRVSETPHSMDVATC